MSDISECQWVSESNEGPENASVVELIMKIEDVQASKT